MSKWVGRAAWTLALLIAFALGVDLGHSVQQFRFLTPEQFASILAAFSGYGWPIAIILISIVYRRAIRRAIIILAWRISGFKAPGVQTAFAPLTGQARTQVRRGVRDARVSRTGAERAVSVVALERRTDALLRVARELSETPVEEGEPLSD